MINPLSYACVASVMAYFQEFSYYLVGVYLASQLI